MSNSEGNVQRTDIPSTDEIINEVVDSCKRVQIDEEKDEKVENKEEGQGEGNDDDYIDESLLKDLDVGSSSEELERRRKSAVEDKDAGNSLFKDKDYINAGKKYTQALRTCPLEFKEERAILFANRGAAKLQQGLKKEAIEDCTKAIELNPNYVKAFIRRAKLYEEIDKLDEALEDYKKIAEFDPGNSEARAALMRLPSQINERNEKLKAEMLGSLKELGNKLLKPFGLSTDNFQVQQDPNSGGYSINFTQNRK